MTINAHPVLPEFDYIRPNSLQEASQFLAQHAGQARPLCGGTDIFVRMRDGVWTDQYLVDIKHLPEMSAIQFDPAEGLTIGAGVCMNRVIKHSVVQERYPLLAQAAASCASYQLRNRASVIGNICNASPAGDTIGACLLLGGELSVHGVDGKRIEPLDSFFLAPGKTRLKVGDIVTSLRLPVPPTGSVGSYSKLGRNELSDLSIVGISVFGFPDKSLRSGMRIRLALASVAPTPLVVNQVEQILGEDPITEQSIHAAAVAAMEACHPIDDVRASAQYRKYMVRNLSENALKRVWTLLK